MSQSIISASRERNSRKEENKQVPNASRPAKSVWPQNSSNPQNTQDADNYKKLSISTFWITIAVIDGLWLAYMVWTWQFHLFLKDWFMTVVMVFGSFIAGSTSEGGGAVAFPVMTLFFHISPDCARNFCLAIQSVGMSAAAFAIWRCKISVERNAIIFATLGGAVGIILGTLILVPYLTDPAYIKMFFASLWLSFIVALYTINRNRNREVYSEIVGFKPRREGMMLLSVGILGGIVTSLTGSGLDILTFSFLCLWYRVSEKVATPTSVVLMAGNSIVGFLTHLFLINQPNNDLLFIQGDFHLEAWKYWLVSIPAVVIGAPAGARFIRQKSRLFIAVLLYTSLVVQFLAAIFILKPQGLLLIFTITIFTIGACLFFAIAYLGRRRINLAAHLEPRIQGFARNQARKDLQG